MYLNLLKKLKPMTQSFISICKTKLYFVIIKNVFESLKDNINNEFNKFFI